MKNAIAVHAITLAVVALATMTRPARAQDRAALVMPTYVLQKIALDYDQGRNPFYCYFGARAASTPERVRVDSVTTVAAPAECSGNGLGFVSRLEDRFFLVNALKGLIDAMPQFLVVSAFYRTEDVEHDGRKVHAAHALSIIRGVVAAASNGGGRS